MIARRGFLFAAAALGSVALVRAPAKPAQFEFKCGSELAPDHPSVQRLMQMFASIEQESGGRLHTQVFPNNILGGEEAMLAQVRVGALQFLFVPSGTLGGVVPAAMIGYLGFAYKDADEALRVFDGHLGEYVRAESMAKGIYALRPMWDGGMFQVGSTTHSIRNPDDLRNFKIRVAQTKILFDLFKVLGASPTPIGFAELYTGLQTRIIDGESSPLVVIETSKFYEINKYVSITNHAWVGEWLVASAEVWKSLPPDLQAIVERNHLRYAMLGRRDNKALTGTLASTLTKHGITINTVDQGPFRARLGSYFQEYASTFGPTEWGLLESAIGRKLV